jgi:ParB family chromosome partitioning protein
VNHLEPREDRVELLSIDALEPGPNQPRRAFEASTIEGLSDSVREHGIIEPLLVRPLGGGPRFEIVIGERRWRAARLAGLLRVPAIVRILDDDEAFSHSLAENVARESLPAIDEVLAVARLAAAHGVREAGRRLGKPHSWVSKRKRLSEAPAFVVDFLATGKSKDVEAHYELAKLAEKDPDSARLIIQRHPADGHLRAEVKAIASVQGDGDGDVGDGEESGNDVTVAEENGSHANHRDSYATRSRPGDHQSDADFRLESREDEIRSADMGDEEDEDGRVQKARQPPWRPSDALELEQPFAPEAILVTSVEAKRAGHLVLTTAMGETAYELTERARVQLQAILGAP